MVISISPGAEDEKTKLTNLKIESSFGRCTSPNRIVNRNDMSAKEQLGLDIQLGGKGRSLFYELPLNMNDVLILLNNKKLFEEKFYSIGDTKNRFRQSGTMFFLGPNLTREAYENLINSKRVKKFVNAFCRLAKHLELESVHLPDFNDIKSIKNYVNKFDLQYIPMLDPKKDSTILKKQLDDFDSFACADSPFLSFKFRTFDNDDSNYDLIKTRIEKWHNKNKAVMVHDAERQLKNCENVSGIHYSSLMTADLTVERFARGYGKNDETPRLTLDQFIPVTSISTADPVRWFSRTSLQISKVNDKRQQFDFSKMLRMFFADNEILELINRISNNALTDNDIKNMRGSYMSRISENMDSHDEFLSFAKYVEENSVMEYIENKPIMNSVLKSHLTSNSKLDEYF